MSQMPISINTISEAETWNIEWIVFRERDWRLYYRVSYSWKDWKTLRKDISISQRIAYLLKSWALNQEQVIIEAKIEALKECFRLKSQWILNMVSLEEAKQNLNFETFLESLINPDWSLTWIFFEEWHRYSHFAICLRVKRTIDGVIRTTSFKINRLKDGSEIRDLKWSLETAIINLCEWFWFNKPLEKDLLLITNLAERSIWFYNNGYNNMLRKSTSSMKSNILENQAA